MRTSLNLPTRILRALVNARDDGMTDKEMAGLLHASEGGAASARRLLVASGLCRHTDIQREKGQSVVYTVTLRGVEYELTGEPVPQHPIKIDDGMVQKTVSVIQMRGNYEIRGFEAPAEVRGEVLTIQCMSSFSCLAGDKVVIR